MRVIQRQLVQKFDELFRCVGGYANIIHILGALICFDDCVEVFPHDAWKCWQGPANSLSKHMVGKCSSSKIGCKEFYWPLVCHLEAVVGLWAFQFAEQLFLRYMLCRIGEGADEVVVVDVVVRDEGIDLSQVD